MAAYNYLLDAFEAIGAQVVALSTDSLADTAAFAAAHRLDVPLVCELEYPSAPDRLGAYMYEEQRAFQATGFVLDAEHRVMSSVYSTTNIGRLTPEEALRLLS